MDILVSLYKDAKTTIATREITLLNFIDNIRNGLWQDVVIPLRAEKDKDKKIELKKKLVGVTVSGTFGDGRGDAQMKKHSGFINIDLDNLGSDVEGVRSILMADPYVFTCFVSAGGSGLCAIFKIDGEKHREAFEGIEKYLYENYQLIVDKSGKNESRLRFASYDPHLNVKLDALKFKKYLPKTKAKPAPKVVFVQTDFDAIIKGLAECGASLCDDYNEWISIGFALASEFSYNGFDYFDTLSRCSSKYDGQTCYKQYENLCKSASDAKDKKSTIGTIYFLAKRYGIPTYSEKTKKILGAATVLKKSGLPEKAVIKSLQEFDNISPEDSEDIVSQCFKENIELHGEDSIITSIEQWLRYNHSIRRNAITRKVENNGLPMETKHFYGLFLAAKKIYPELDYGLFEKIVLSDSLQEYNPFNEFFAAYADRQPTGVIDALWSSFKTTDDEHLRYFGTKWLVGLISAMHGQHSPLMLIFCGGQNTGKTEAFRRMLPAELRAYYAESKLDAGKDDEILMTQKLLIVDDEMGGKSKADSKKLKDLTSKQTFSLREPYGRNNVDLHRLAVLAGTTNDTEVLNDPTGNRRFLPSEIISIMHAAFNAVDKIDLIMEAYSMYKAGFNWQLTKEDIARLNKDTTQFEEHILEAGLIEMYLLHPAQYPQAVAISMTATEIKVLIEEKSKQRISLKRLGMELQKMGFEQEIIKPNGKTKRVYKVVKCYDEQEVHVPKNPYTPPAGCQQTSNSSPNFTGEVPF